MPQLEVSGSFDKYLKCIICIAGFGFGILMTLGLVLPGFVFGKQNSIMLILTSAGAGVGILTIPYLFQYLIRTMGWRMTMIIHGCIIAQAHIIVAITIKDIPITNSKPDKNKNALRRIVGIDLFLFFINQILWNFGGVIALVFTADLANDRNLTKTDASLLVSLVGLSSVVIRLLLGLVGKYVYLDAIIIFTLGHILRGSGIILLPLSINLLWCSCLCSIVIGVGFGIEVGLLVPSITKIFGQDQTPMAAGISLMGSGIGSLGGPPLAGEILFQHMLNLFILFS